MTGELLDPIPRHQWVSIPLSTAIRFPKAVFPWTVAFLVFFALPRILSEDIYQTPSITSPKLSTLLYVKEQKRVSITCTATGMPKPSYAWMRHGHSIEDAQYNISYDAKTGSLTFSSFQSGEAGAYSCMAYNSHLNSRPVTMSPPQTIRLARIDPFALPGYKRIYAEEYQYARLKCFNQREVIGDDITYQWYLEPGLRQITDMQNGRLYISSDGALHFIYTRSSDTLDGQGRYKCGIASTLLRTIKMGQEMVLLVSSSVPMAQTPILRYSNTGIQASVASSVRLECVYSGYDPVTPTKLPMITWTDLSGKRISSDGKKFELEAGHNVLVIHDLQEDDEGDYYCQGTISSGSSRKHAVRLNLTSPPVWEEAPESLIVAEGGDATIRCVPRSLKGELPPGAPTWMINAVPFAQVRKSNAVLSKDFKSLTLTDVSRDKDIVCVQCIAENSVGLTVGDACINVILRITVALHCNKCQKQRKETCSCTRVTLPLGDSITFTFTARTDPAFANKLEYQWIHDGLVYKVPELPPHMTKAIVDGVTAYTLSAANLAQDQYDDLKGQYIFRTSHSHDMNNIVINVNKIDDAKDKNDDTKDNKDDTKDKNDDTKDKNDNTKDKNDDSKGNNDDNTKDDNDDTKDKNDDSKDNKDDTKDDNDDTKDDTKDDNDDTNDNDDDTKDDNNDDTNGNYDDTNDNNSDTNNTNNDTSKIDPETAAESNDQSLEVDMWVIFLLLAILSALVLFSIWAICFLCRKLKNRKNTADGHKRKPDQNKR